MNNLHFISELTPGQKRNRRETSAIRSHVRRAVLQDLRQADISKRLRLYRVNRDGLSTVNKESKERNAPQVQRQLTLLHPYTTAATALLPLPTSRVDGLFKGPFFQRATEPLFSTSHVDSEVCMDAAFPGCMINSSFMCALLYSIVQMQNKGKPSLEALQLHSLALKSLSMTFQPSASYADIGTIMILQGVAYRWKDEASHTAHTNALCSIRLSERGATQSCFTDLARKAFFCQDLFASLLKDSRRHETRLSLVEVQWQRQEASPRRPFPDLPLGFLEHCDILPEDLVNCIKDITELQSIVRSMNDSSSNRILVSNMQISTESRLASVASHTSSSIIRCCSLALFITCLLSFTETWGDALIPCRLSDMVCVALYESIAGPDWSSHRSLQMRCLLVGSTVAPLNDGYVEVLSKRWDELSVLFRGLDVTWPEYVTSAVQDFVYVERLMSHRMSVSAWAGFEEEALSSQWGEGGSGWGG